MSQKPILAIRSLSAVFPDANGGLCALEDVSFDVHPREFVCVLGPSGSGKTTLLRILAGLIAPTSGSFVFGHGEQPSTGMVFQQATLMPWRTVIENIMLPLEVKQVDEAPARARAKEMIELVGLEGFEDSLPRDLSGGMAQRVAIARALIHDPDLLLLDEPFSALDAQTRELMQEELTRVWQADGAGTGKTAVFVTHDVPEAVFLADRVIVFSRGPAHLVEVVEVDLPRPRGAGVKRSPRFQEISDHILSLVMSQNQPGRRTEDHDSNAALSR
jgi:NitT/TauT family transport system ATP-binding protein